MPRIYVDHDLAPGSEFALSADAAHHVRGVLRLPRDARIVVFNGRGGEYDAVLVKVSRGEVRVAVGERAEPATESPLAVTLVQAVSRGERMDYTLQKAVELGVVRIVPVSSQRTVVRLDAERAARRLEHWRGIVRHAAEQSGRVVVPCVDEVRPLAAWLAARPDGTCYVLHPRAPTSLTRAPRPHGRVTIVAGPEGGFDATELAALAAAGVGAVRLGPRTLRTETAALAALCAMQTLWGDLG